MAVKKNRKQQQQRKQQKAQRHRRRQQKRRPTRPAGNEEIDQGIDQDMVQRIVQTHGLKDVHVISTPPGEQKISDALLAFAEPYIEPEFSRQEREMVLQFATLAWNTALMPEEKRAEMLANFSRTIPNPKDFPRELMEEMIERKLAEFPDDRRMIVDFELREDEDNFYLNVAAAMSAPPNK